MTRTRCLARRHAHFNAIARDLLAVVLTVAAPAAVAAQEPLAFQDLTELSLEQLSQIVVTTPSLREQPLSVAPASIYVITREDIRRAGVFTLPEALRLAPNLQVARADANQYAITARGFNSVLANKMLVRIDGRAVYSPLFSGVFWEAQDLLLDDIDRIEVVSGPGGTLWGANAVNGVINVITKHARETHGLMAAARAGSENNLAKVRYGVGNARGHLRVMGKFLDVDESERADGTPILDEAQRWFGGFRGDWEDSVQSFVVRGSALQTEIEQLPDERVGRNYYLFGHWRRAFGPNRTLWLYGYYDRTERDQPGAINDRLNTYEGELQYSLRLPFQHELVGGVGHRYQTDRLDNLGPSLAFIPADQDLRLTQVFAQDQIYVTPNTDLILGMRLAHDEYTDWEFLPCARVAWRAGPGRLVWGALSRVVRTPSRVDREFYSPAAPPHFILAGGPEFDSEVAHVAELGYRGQPTPLVSYSVTAFVHDYDRLRSLQPTPEGPQFENGWEATVHGLEAWGSVRVREWWRLDGGVVGQRRALRRDPGNLDPTEGTQLGNDPEYWLRVHSGFDIAARHELDLWLRHVGELPDPKVPSYTAVDARLGVELTRNVEFSVAGYNLFDARHPEWGVAPTRSNVERSAFVELRVLLWNVD